MSIFYTCTRARVPRICYLSEPKEATPFPLSSTSNFVHRQRYNKPNSAMPAPRRKAREGGGQGANKLRHNDHASAERERRFRIVTLVLDI